MASAFCVREARTGLSPAEKQGETGGLGAFAQKDRAVFGKIFPGKPGENCVENVDGPGKMSDNVQDCAKNMKTGE